ncbi:MAG: Holliday junction resolvase RuvX [Caldilineaceae bacterium]
MSDATTGKLLALDVGLARIGVAVCDPLRLAARPVTVIKRRSRNEDFAQLASLAQEEEVVAIICGLPLNMDGSEGFQAQSVRKWAERCAYALRARVGRSLPIVFWDERLSTFAAQELLNAEEHKRGKEIGEDAAAAAVILQSYLDAAKLGERPDFGAIQLP